MPLCAYLKSTRVMLHGVSVTHFLRPIELYRFSERLLLGSVSLSEPEFVSGSAAFRRVSFEKHYFVRT